MGISVFGFLQDKNMPKAESLGFKNSKAESCNLAFKTPKAESLKAENFAPFELEQPYFGILRNKFFLCKGAIAPRGF